MEWSDWRRGSRKRSAWSSSGWRAGALRLAVCFGFLAVVACGAEPGENHHQASLPLEDEGGKSTFEHADTGFETDAAIVAKEMGLPLEQIQASLRFQERFALEVQAALGDMANVAAVWMDPVPATRGHVVFVGEVPEQARTLAADPNMELSGGGELSMAEQRERVRMFAEAMGALGHDHRSTFYDPRRQRIVVETSSGNGRRVDKARVAALVAERLAQVPGLGLGRNPSAADFDLEETTEEAMLDSTLGGETLRDDGVFECTSGWTVIRNGIRGVMSARHCDGLNQTVSADGTWSMQFQQQSGDLSNGFWNGDVDWHSTNGAEIGNFFASQSTIRSVLSTRTTAFHVGATICHYGRGSNVRTCNHVVDSNNVCLNVPAIGETICTLARATAPGTITAGDSGGGWSLDNTVYGVHSAHTTTKAYYTPIDEGTSLLGLTLLNSGL